MSASENNKTREKVQGSGSPPDQPSGDSQRPSGGGSDQERAEVPRLISRIPRLDIILQGGFLRGGMYSVVGPPGSGKTILGNQVCFNHAREGGRAVYVTLLAESHARMLLHLRPMNFYAPELVGSAIRYVSGFAVLEQQGLPGLQELLRKAVREHRATLLVIDGLQAVEAYAETPLAFQKFLRELQAYAGLLDCTTLLLTPTSASRLHAENTMVDGILELSHQLIGPRAVRELTVHKFRGSEYLLGRHEVQLGAHGIVIHPRTEVLFDKPPPHAIEERIRMPFGISKLDEMLNGGLLSGSATTLLGAPGTGKTMLGLQYLVEGARRGQPGVYFGFYETPPRLIEKARNVGIDLEGACKSGLVEVQWQPPLEYTLDSLAERLLERIRERNVKRLRVFIDGFAGFRGALVYPDRLPRFFAALTHELRSLDVTTVLAEETGLFRSEIELPNEELAAVVENIILLRHVELRSQLYRLLSILKVRESAYDASIREFRILDTGIEVAHSFRSAESILTGHARLTPAEPLAPQAEQPPAKRKPRKAEGSTEKSTTKAGSRAGSRSGKARRRS
jgi:circadian clock protein KaiC